MIAGLELVSCPAAPSFGYQRCVRLIDGKVLPGRRDGERVNLPRGMNKVSVSILRGFVSRGSISGRFLLIG